jgi:outer membrane receptor protein involved in Fe transport
VLLVVTMPAVAQDGDEVIEEIQVTATRRPVEVRDVSAALTVVTSEDINRSKLMTDSLAARPGVFLQQTTPGQGAAIIRGLKGSEVLHVVDGMRLNNAIFRNAPTQYMALVAPGTLERIEVVRGAPASLYGSDAVGGVVQALSRVPSLDAAGYRGDAFVAFDSADLAKILRASVEFGDERVAAIVSGEYLETGDRRIAGGQRIAPSGYESEGARVAVSLSPDDKSRWLFDLQAARQPNTPRTDELVPGFGQTEPSSEEFWFSPNERVFAHIRHTREDGWFGADWNVDLGWQRIVDDRITRAYQSDIRRYEDNRSDLYGLTVSATADTTAGSWIIGAEVYHDDVASGRVEENLATGTTEAVAARFPDGASMDQAAIFGNYLFDIGDRHTLSAGLRLSAISTDLPAVGPVEATSADQEDFSGDLGWIYALTENTLLTANFGYGFRAPNVFDLGTLGERPGNRFNIPNPDLESERIRQIDVGVRHYGERIEIDGSVFLLHYTDRITSVSTGATNPDGRDITQSRNVASADIWGVELGGRMALSGQATAELVLNYVRGEQEDESGTTVPGDRIPPFNGRLSIDYEWSPSVRIEPYLQFAAGQDRLSPRDERDTRIDPDGTPGWMTVNLRTEWDVNERWRLAATLENLLDKRYRVHGSGVDAVGRNLFVSLQATW